MNVEYNAAKTLLDKGIKVEVTSPLWLRAFGKRSIKMVIRQPYLGTLYRVSELFLSMGIDDAELEKINEGNAHQLFTKHGRTLAAIAAQALLNGYWMGKLFGGMMARKLFWRLTPSQLLTIAHVMVTIGGTSAFTNTIRFVGAMKMTSPNLSQQNQGS